MKHIGIWIDKRQAKIVEMDGSSETLSTLLSEVDEFHPKGGSGTKYKGGPQDVVQDSKYLNREKLQLSDYFSRVVTKVNTGDEIVILGPAETGEKLFSELKQKHPEVHSKTKSVEKADNMTDNQLKAWVRDYFHKKTHA